MEHVYNGMHGIRKDSKETAAAYAADSKIEDVVRDPVFGDYGRLIVPADEWYHSGETLKDLRLIWYNHIDPEKTVEIVNDMHDRADEFVKWARGKHLCSSSGILIVMLI